MEPVRIREDVDPKSPEYRRRLIIVVLIVLGLFVLGGTILASKIRTAENARDAAEQQEGVEQPETPDNAHPAQAPPSR